MNPILEHYQPSRKSWLAAIVVALCVLGIVFWVFSSDWSFKLNSVLQIEIDNGEGADEINVYNVEGGFGA